MITVNATGFVPTKPELLLVGRNRQRKCEFTVVAQRRQMVAGEWETVWERATFVAWDEEAERVASTLDKGMDVNCTGIQETSKWTDNGGQQRHSVRHRLLAWQVIRRARPAEASDGERGASNRRHREDEIGGDLSAAGAHAPSSENYLPM